MRKPFCESGFVSFNQYCNYYTVENGISVSNFGILGRRRPEKWPPQPKFDPADIDFYVIY
jgi:hypothetical protein